METSGERGPEDVSSMSEREKTVYATEGVMKSCGILREQAENICFNLRRDLMDAFPEKHVLPVQEIESLVKYTFHTKVYLPLESNVYLSCYAFNTIMDTIILNARNCELSNAYFLPSVFGLIDIMFINEIFTNVCNVKAVLNKYIELLRYYYTNETGSEAVMMILAYVLHKIRSTIIRDKEKYMEVVYAVSPMGSDEFSDRLYVYSTVNGELNMFFEKIIPSLDTLYDGLKLGYGETDTANRAFNRLGNEMEKAALVHKYIFFMLVVFGRFHYDMGSLLNRPNMIKDVRKFFPWRRYIDSLTGSMETNAEPVMRYKNDGLDALWAKKTIYDMMINPELYAIGFVKYIEEEFDGSFDTYHEGFRNMLKFLVDIVGWCPMGSLFKRQIPVSVGTKFSIRMFANARYVLKRIVAPMIRNTLWYRLFDQETAMQMATFLLRLCLDRPAVGIAEDYASIIAALLPLVPFSEDLFGSLGMFDNKLTGIDIIVLNLEIIDTELKQKFKEEQYNEKRDQEFDDTVREAVVVKQLTERILEWMIYFTEKREKLLVSNDLFDHEPSSRMDESSGIATRDGYGKLEHHHHHHHHEDTEEERNERYKRIEDFLSHSSKFHKDHKHKYRKTHSGRAGSESKEDYILEDPPPAPRGAEIPFPLERTATGIVSK